MYLVAFAALVVSVRTATQESAPASPACALPESDRAWIERALEAWRFTTREVTGIERLPPFQAILFSADCVLTSENALTSPDGRGVTWSAAPHAGTVTMPDGNQIPTRMTSFASGKDGVFWFAMATPTVWEAAGVIGKGPNEENSLIPVLLHEASHVAQLGPYGRRLGALIEQNSLPDSFNDDAVQERFKSDQEFAASIARETALFLDAAAKTDDAEAKLLAFEARELMRERAARWFVGDDAYLAEADHVWLTFEGSGQWVAYQWCIHPKGGAEAPADAMPRYARGSSWSQTHGFALVMALDRIAGPGWKRHAFGDGAQSVIEMLDAALGD